MGGRHAAHGHRHSAYLNSSPLWDHLRKRQQHSGRWQPRQPPTTTPCWSSGVSEAQRATRGSSTRTERRTTCGPNCHEEQSSRSISVGSILWITTTRSVAIGWASRTANHLSSSSSVLEHRPLRRVPRWSLRARSRKTLYCRARQPRASSKV